jgi:hypothetical protein
LRGRRFCKGLYCTVLYSTTFECLALMPDSNLKASLSHTTAFAQPQCTAPPTMLFQPIPPAVAHTVHNDNDQHRHMYPMMDGTRNRDGAVFHAGRPHDPCVANPAYTLYIILRLVPLWGTRISLSFLKPINRTPKPRRATLANTSQRVPRQQTPSTDVTVWLKFSLCKKLPPAPCATAPRPSDWLIIGLL